MAKKKVKEPQYYVSKINTQVLNYNVYVMKPMEKLLYFIVLLVAGGAIGLIFYGGLFKVNGEATMMTTISNVVVFLTVGLLANKFFIPSINEKLRKKRIDKLKAQFCEFLSTLTNALATGMNINDSLNAVFNDLKEQYSEESFIVKEVSVPAENIAIIEVN